MLHTEQSGSQACPTCARAKGDSEGCVVPKVALGDSGGRMEAGAIAKGDSGPGAAAAAGVADLCCTCRIKDSPLRYHCCSPKDS